MNEKTDAQVVIGGRTYTLSGYESEEYLLRVAGYLNGKIDELNADPDYGRLDLYDIKHELVAAQMKLQSAEKKKK